MEWPILWNARWIWDSAPLLAVSPLEPGLPPPQTWNRFCYLRRSFDLENPPAAVPARMTADSRFILYVNGVEAARGPARSMPERLAWLETDLAPYLHRGRNAVATLVRFYGQPGPWWVPARANFQLGFGSFAFEAPAIGVVSDSSWKGRRAPYRRDVRPSTGLPNPPIEILDGAGIPAGWTQAEFDDSRWDPAVELSCATLAPNRRLIPVEPYSAPEPADLASLTAIPLTLAKVSQRTVPAVEAEDPRDAYPEAGPSGPEVDGDPMVTYDAGSITLATPWIEAQGPRGSIIDVYCGEELRSDASAETRPRRYAMRYLLAGGPSERVEAYEAVGFRYLTVIARKGARIEAAGAVERRYPRAAEARFECDDERLNTIWKVGARTLEVSTTDAFVDCPGREQRAWLGDSYISSLIAMTISSDWRIVRRHLRICAHSRRADGLLGMTAAGDFAIAPTTIPDFSLHWVRALARYFDYSGDRETIGELIATAAEVLEAFERYRASDGLIRRMPGWTFIDWAMVERSEATGALDALYAAALEDFAALSERAAGNLEAAERARERARRTRSAFDLLWDDGRGVYVDASDACGPLRRVSQQTNAMAIVSGCAPRSRWRRMLNYVLDENRLVLTPTISDRRDAYISQRLDPAEYQRFDSEYNVVMAQPFFCHFLHDAMVRAGRRDLVASDCLRWWPQIKRGNTTFEEYWEARSGTGSRCHPFSATPTYDLTAHVMGIRPIEPGFRIVELKPLFGRLRRLVARVPTPHGLIEVRLDRMSGGTLSVPKGITVVAGFEDAGLRGGTFPAGSHRVAPR